jgi:hypothetical protein
MPHRPGLGRRNLLRAAGAGALAAVSSAVAATTRPGAAPAATPRAPGGRLPLPAGGQFVRQWRLRAAGLLA